MNNCQPSISKLILQSFCCQASIAKLLLPAFYCQASNAKLLLQSFYKPSFYCQASIAKLLLPAFYIANIPMPHFKTHPPPLRSKFQSAQYKLQGTLRWNPPPLSNRILPMESLWRPHTRIFRKHAAGTLPAIYKDAVFVAHPPIMFAT